ncbi:hypothetical protein C8J56DRAFT_1045802 [Mycena floridula]|nr:hypothetical protein C8J56DRAFT_1045802 [Mycena floridula]
MFKRIEKKRKKREEEEELGLDEDMKEIMGLNDTDSDESDSDSDEDNSDDGEPEDELNDGALDEEEEEEDDDDDDLPLITVEETLKDPLYLASLEPVKVIACVLCPGKSLKTPQMLQMHRDSNACPPTTIQTSSAWDFVPKTKPGEQLDNTVSKREAKRMAKEVKFKQRREKQKLARKRKKDQPRPPPDLEAKPAKTVEKDAFQPDAPRKKSKRDPVAPSPAKRHKVYKKLAKQPN